MFSNQTERVGTLRYYARTSLDDVGLLKGNSPIVDGVRDTSLSYQGSRGLGLTLTLE
jgi:hypothetical protein